MTTIEFDEGSARLNALAQRIVDANGKADLRFVWTGSMREWPHWFSDLTSKLWLLIGDADVVYLTSTVTSEPSPSGELYLYTENAVVHATVNDGDAQRGTATIHATTWSRLRPVEVKVLDSSVFPSEGSGRSVRFPQRVRLEVAYEGRDAIKLPLDGVYESQDEISTFYESLIADQHKLDG